MSDKIVDKIRKRILCLKIFPKIVPFMR